MQSGTTNTNRDAALDLTLSLSILVKLFCFPERESYQTNRKHKKHECFTKLSQHAGDNFSFRGLLFTKSDSVHQVQKVCANLC